MTPSSAPSIGTQPPVYILDTSVLYWYLRGEAGFGNEDSRASPPDRRLQRAIQHLLNNEEIAIPHIAVVEILGQLFHTYIDLAYYSHWHRQRQIAFNPILSLLIRDPDRVWLLRDTPRFEALGRAHQPFSTYLQSQLRTHYPNPAQYRPREPKCLDGVDAQILDDALCLAMTHPGRRCELLSSDRLFRLVIDDIQHHSSTQPDLPGNLYFRSLHQLPNQLGIS
jgi:hypothetical protein